jgi:NADPH-dependent 2,4-dienoyl-CoA reductase/sulfur reductase-like enzyme
MRAIIEDIKDSPTSGADPSGRLERRKTEDIATPHRPPTSYPSQALRFLEKANERNATSTPSIFLPEQARIKMSIIVVGAGLGGLALAIALARRGHSVRVLEQASKLGEVRSVILSDICMLTQSLGRRRNPDSTKLRAPTTRLGCF